MNSEQVVEQVDMEYNRTPLIPYIPQVDDDVDDENEEVVFNVYKSPSIDFITSSNQSSNQSSKDEIEYEDYHTKTTILYRHTFSQDDDDEKGYTSSPEI